MPAPPSMPISPSTSRLDVIVGLGSNLGDRLAFLAAGAAGLHEFTGLSACSFVYETAPIGPPQPHYLNAAVRFETERSPAEVLAVLLEIERLCGRERRERWGPRTLDLDLLWIDGRSVDEPGLTVPHARLNERPFALLPLLDVAPDAADPRTGTPYWRVVAALDCSEMRQLERLDFRGARFPGLCVDG